MRPIKNDYGETYSLFYSFSLAVHLRHKIIIDEVKTEINDGYDLCQDSYLLDVLVHRGIQIGKAQAVPEGFVLVPAIDIELALLEQFGPEHPAVLESQEQGHD